MSKFIENFKEAASIIPFGHKNPYDPFNLPPANGNSVTASYRERVGVPFSYTKDVGGTEKSDYGILWVPKYEASKINRYGTFDKKEIETYGAELQNGLSLTSKGFNDMYQKDPESFSFGFPYEERSRGDRPDSMKKQRETMRNRQKSEDDRITEFFNNLKKIIKQDDNSNNSGRIGL